VVRRIFDVRVREEYRDAEDFVLSLISVTLHPILLM